MSACYRLKCTLSAFLFAVAMLAVSACSEEGRPVKGFILPEGDVAQGEQVFIDFNCHTCHGIPGMEFPDVGLEPPFVVEIGGEVYRVRDYGELLTSSSGCSLRRMSTR